MSNKHYVQPPKESYFKKAAEEMKNAYSYLHPDYWKRKLVHLISYLRIDLWTYIYGSRLYELHYAVDT